MLRKGRQKGGSYLSIRWMYYTKGTRLGITISSRYGTAPERNRFKRLVREAFRLSRSQLPSGVDLNILPRKAAKIATLDKIQKELCHLLLVDID